MRTIPAHQQRQTRIATNREVQRQRGVFHWGQPWMRRKDARRQRERPDANTHTPKQSRKRFLTETTANRYPQLFLSRSAASTIRTISAWRKGGRYTKHPPPPRHIHRKRSQLPLGIPPPHSTYHPHPFDDLVEARGHAPRAVDGAARVAQWPRRQPLAVPGALDLEACRQSAGERRRPGRRRQSMSIRPHLEVFTQSFLTQGFQKKGRRGVVAAPGESSWPWNRDRIALLMRRR